MKKVIHVNQHVIKSNKKTGKQEAPITVKTYKSNNYASEVQILDNNGKVIATVVYKPEAPLSCGASVWIETEYEVAIL